MPRGGFALERTYTLPPVNFTARVPALLAAGLPPVSANVSNTVGLVPGSVSGDLIKIFYTSKVTGSKTKSRGSAGSSSRSPERRWHGIW